MPIAPRTLPMPLWKDFPDSTYVIHFLNCSTTSVPCGIKLSKKPRAATQIPILYGPSNGFWVITSLYTEAPVLRRLRSPKTSLITALSSTNPHHIHCATSLAIAQTTFKTCQLQRPLLLSPLHFPPASQSHDSVLTDDITTHPTTSYHYIYSLSRSSHLTTLPGRYLDSMLSPAIPPTQPQVCQH
jgi:hypothetical protein